MYHMISSETSLGQFGASFGSKTNQNSKIFTKMDDKRQEAYDATIDKQYQCLVPFLGQEHVVSRLAITKEMVTFDLENFEVSERTLVSISFAGSFQTDVFLH